MTHRRHDVKTEPELPLDYAASEEPPLRAAFATLVMSRTMTFEQAMADPALAIGIRNTAVAIAAKAVADAKPHAEKDA